MKAMLKAGAVGFAAVMVTSCATMPTYQEVERSAVLSRTKDEVWGDLVAFFATNSIPIRTIEKDSGLIVAERQSAGVMSGQAFAAWMNCGRPGFLEVTESRTVNLNVLVRERGAGQTEVTVTTLFHENRAMDQFRSSVECASTGRLEELVLRQVRGPA